MLVMMFTSMVGIVIVFAFVLNSMSQDQLFILFIYGGGALSDAAVKSCIEAIQNAYWVIIASLACASIAAAFIPGDFKGRPSAPPTKPPAAAATSSHLQVVGEAEGVDGGPRTYPNDDCMRSSGSGTSPAADIVIVAEGDMEIELTGTGAGTHSGESSATATPPRESGSPSDDPHALTHNAEAVASREVMPAGPAAEGLVEGILYQEIVHGVAAHLQPHSTSVAGKAREHSSSGYDHVPAATPTAAASSALSRSAGNEAV